MTTPQIASPSPAEPKPRREADAQPISMSVVMLLANARGSARIFEAGREDSFAASPEALASLPGHLNALARGAGGGALQELNKFLKLLAEPEPPVEEPPPALASPAPSMCVAPEPETPATEPALELPAEPPPPVEDYRIPLASPLLL